MCAAGLLLALAPYTNAILQSPAFGHLADQPIHLKLSKAFAQALADGEVPPSWAGSLNGGRGGPAFVLYPPLFFLLVWVCSFVAPSFKAALGLALLASAAWLFGVTFYLARAELSIRRSVLAATLAPLLPGVALIGWGRGLLPSFFALGWLALLFGAVFRIAVGPLRRRDLVTLFAAAAGLVLTHALTTAMAGVLLLLCLPVLAPRLGARSLAACLGAAVAAAVATAWFWAPLLRAAAAANTSYLAELHPYERTLWLRPPDPPGALLQSWDEVNDFALIVSGVQLALAAAAAIALRGTVGKLFPRTLPWVAGFVCLASVYPFGAWLAKAPGLSFMQFSWRWQGPLAIWCALGVAAVPRGRMLAPGCLFAAAALFFLPMFSPSDALPADPARISSKPLSPDEFAALEPPERALYVSNLIEMRPRGSAETRFPPADPGRCEIVSGQAAMRPLRIGQARREYRVNAKTPVTLRLHTYAFPGWQARWMGQPLEIRAEAGSKLQLVDLPAGEGLLRLDFSRRALLWADAVP